jgi:phosphotransferase system enzyme I (PtsP)
VSVGSNDLTQFLFAADRSNSRVANRFDSLSVASLRALKQLARACQRHNVPLTLCGEMAGRPIEAMCLIGLGFRTLSMAPASIGPVKTMILSLSAEAITLVLDRLLIGRTGSLRAELEKFAADNGIEL